MMRCEQVIGELAAPSDDRDSIALATHLEACEKCATWARQADQFDRLWNATRPAEPSRETWSAVWANVAALLENSASGHSRAETKRIASRGVRTHAAAPPPVAKARPWSVIGIVMAQAAAILLAVTLAWSPSVPRATNGRPKVVATLSEQSVSPSVALPVDGLPVVIEEGRLVVIREAPESRQVLVPVFTANLSMLVLNARGSAPRVLDRTPEEGGFGVDDCVMYNVFESIPSPVVAMKE